MSYSLDEMLVIGVASSALFDLSESDAVFGSRERLRTVSIKKRILIPYLSLELPSLLYGDCCP